MAVVIAWLLLPVVALAVAAGHGQLVEWATGSRLPGLLVLPVGLAAVVVVTQLVVFVRPLAPSTPWLVAALAVTGLVVGRDRLSSTRPALPATLAAVAVFCVYAGPSVLTGTPAFAGYTSLGDTAVHFSLIDQLMNHGATVSGLPPSSVQTSLSAYLGSSYPTGAHTALGALLPFVGLDVAWVYQPFLAVLGAMSALALITLAGSALGPGAPAAVAGGVAALPALMYSYVLQGSIKELATVWLLSLLCALLPWTLETSPSPRRAVPLAVVSAASLLVIDLAVAPWLGPILVGAGAAAVWRWRSAQRRAIGTAALALAVGLAVMATPTLAGIPDFMRVAPTVLTSEGGLGNLIQPLETIQIFGIWPTDYRLQPSRVNALVLLIGVSAAAAVFGAAWLIRCRAWALLLFIGVSALGCWYVTRRGNPWADGKALMIFSPAVVLCAMIGCFSLRDTGRRVEGWILAGLVGVGVLASNALAYHDADMAPYDRLSELGDIGERFAGEGPTLYTEFEEFNKHFLRAMAPTGTTESMVPFPIRARPGELLRFGFSSDLDQLELDFVQGFRTVVVRRGPLASRPPSNFEPRFEGEYYDVWQRDPAAPRVLAHLPLGDRLAQGDTPSCRRVRALARDAARQDGTLVAAPVPRVAVVDPTRAVPVNWVVAPDDPGMLRPVGPGRSVGRANVPADGRYDVWIEGSFSRPVTVVIDRRRVGTAAWHLNPRGGPSLRVGRVDLDAGGAEVWIERGGGTIWPGDGGRNRLVGPVRLVQADAQTSLKRVAPEQARSLCGGKWDWIEVVAR